MEISESMRRAGWRECPDDATFSRWAESGGVWASMVLMPDPVDCVAPTEPGKWYRNGIVNSVYLENGELWALDVEFGNFSPVRHLTGWQCRVSDALEVWRPLRHDPRGWGEQPEDGYKLFSRKILNTMDAELKRMIGKDEKEEDNGDL